MQNLVKLFFAALFKILLLMALTGQHEAQAQTRKTSISVTSDNGKTQISIKEGRGNNFSLEFEGDITLSDNDSDVVAISRGGYLEIKKLAFGSRRRILIEPNSSGKLVKRYYVGGSEKSFEPEGKRWLAEILLDVVRSTTIGAEQRVDRLFNKGGGKAVLNEVGYMDSDYVISYYLKLLLEKDLKKSDLLGVLDVVEEDINSDHHKAEILKSNTRAFLVDEATTDAYIDAAASIDSDHHQSEVLKRSIKDGTISESQMGDLFDIMDNINSDHHKSEVLLAVMENRSLSAENVELLVRASRDINSDHHHASVLRAALSSPGLSKSSYYDFLEAIGNINSDYHSSSVLKELLKKKLNHTDLTELLEIAARQVHSDAHLASVMKIAIKEQDFSKENTRAFAEAIKNINSDHHKAEVLRKLASKDLDDDLLIAVFKMTDSINSDHHHAEALIAFADTTRNRGEVVKDAYRLACNGINSSSHYGRAMKAIQ